MVLSMSVSKQCETLGGGREENRFRSLGSSLMGSLQSLSCVMVVTKQFPLTGEMTCPSLPSASSESTLCSQPVHSHPHTPFFHVGSLRAAKQRDFSNFMYCECHSYKQDENRSQPLSLLSPNPHCLCQCSSMSFICANRVLAPHSAWCIQHRIWLIIHSKNTALFVRALRV